MEFKDLKKKSESELNELLAEQRGRLYELRTKVAVNQLTNVREIRVVRNSISLILTRLQQLRDESSKITK